MTTQTKLTRPNQYPTFCHSCRKKVGENHGNLFTDSTGRYAVDCGGTGSTIAPKATTSGFQPSTFQSAILTAARDTSNHLVIGAVAGSGKTTTIVWLAQEMVALFGRVLFLAFNKAIVEELRTRLPGSVDVATLNSFGARQLRKNLRGVSDPDDAKIRRLAAQLYPVENHPNEEAHRNLQAPLVALARLERATLMGNPQKIADRFGVDLGDADLGLLWNAVPHVVAQARDAALCGRIDFDDQILLPATEQGWSIDQYDTVIVDEAQDLNEAQTRLLLRATGPKGRVIAVGDRYQAIYGFRGAGITAFDDLLSALRSTSRGATELPLSVCYRCPSKAADIVNEEGLLTDAAGKVTEFRTRDGAPAGVVDYLPAVKLREKLTEKVAACGSKNVPQGELLVLCPRNAPLVRPCLGLLVDGVKATIRGRDIGAEIVRLVLRVNPGASGVGRARKTGQEEIHVLLQALHAHADKEITKLRKAEKDAAADKLEDQVAVIVAFSEEADAVSAVVVAIENILTDSAEGVVFSTVHRAKGIEANHVFLMEEWMMPWPTSKQAWERRQGLNLRYVALTRWKVQMTYVTDARHPGPEDDVPGDEEWDQSADHDESYREDGNAFNDDVLPEVTEAYLDANERALLRQDAESVEAGGPLGRCDVCGEDEALPANGLCLNLTCPTLNEERDPESVDHKVADQVKLAGVLSKLPSWPSKGDGTYTPPTLEDWQEVQQAYAVAGCTTGLGAPTGWRQMALDVILPGVRVRVSTTYEAGQAGRGVREKGKNAIDVVVVDENGMPIGGMTKVLRRAGWKGRVAERVNALLRERAR